MHHETLAPLTEAVQNRISATLTRARYEHSLRVAQLSRELCERFSLNPGEGYFAGLAHDMCKEVSRKDLLALAALDGKKIHSIERDKPSLLHGRAAAMVLVHEYGMEDGRITNAVRHHTYGDPELDSLSLVVYVADKMEPGRTGFSEAFREQVLNNDLLTMALLVLDHTIQYLELKGKKVSEETRSMRIMLAKERQ